MAHAPAVGAKDEIAREAIFALSTGNGSGAEPGNTFPQGCISNLPANLDHRAGELMAEYHRRVIAKGIVENVDVGPADSTVGNLQLYLFVPATRLLNFLYVNVAFAACVLDKSFHVGGSSNRDSL
jgi:hypothetical protein